MYSLTSYGVSRSRKNVTNVGTASACAYRKTKFTRKLNVKHLLSTDACPQILVNVSLHHCVNSSVLAVFCSNNFFTSSSSFLFLFLDALLLLLCCCCCWLEMDFAIAACLAGCFVVVDDLTGVGSQKPVVLEFVDHPWLLDALELAQLKHCDAVPHIPAFCSILADSFWPAFSNRSLSCC